MNLRWQFLDQWHDAGLLILRSGVGTVFAGIHGYPLPSEGEKGRIRAGLAMQSLGVESGYKWWGCAAMFTMILGGACLIMGLFHRPASIALGVVTSVASIWLYRTYGGFEAAAYPILTTFVCIGLFILGPGRKALDKT
jgi:uncharacterized membrane protein YphA (DoxX/SURF4 family)